jgi:Flp pilus assembly protein TadD
MTSIAPIHLRLALLIICCCFPIGCAVTGHNSPYASPSENGRDPSKAQRLTLEAADQIDSDPGKAERLLNEALTADIYHGPAHNNLGVLHLKHGRLYEAANEFEWARKLMPGHPDPRMNLALTLEKAGRVDEAMATYDSALEVYPNHMPTMQALTRLQIRRNRTDDRTVEMLQEIALAGQTIAWREWAQRQLIRAGAS